MIENNQTLNNSDFKTLVQLFRQFSDTCASEELAKILVSSFMSLWIKILENGPEIGICECYGWL